MRTNAHRKSARGGRCSRLSRLSACVRAKLTSNAGDTFIEVLSALLISVLAVVLMATMITTATSITSRNEVRMAALFAAQTALSTQEQPEFASGMVTVQGETIAGSSYKVFVYTQDGFTRYEPSFNIGGGDAS